MVEEHSDKPLAISVAEAARRIGVSRNGYYAGLRAGRMPGMQVGPRRYIVPVAALEKWLNGGSQS